MITSICADNFQSWKSLEFKVSSGITLIDGWNYDDGTSEGSGKSSILNALSWGLYGRIPKDVKIDEVINNASEHCAVLIKLTHPKFQAVFRSRNPNKLSLIDLSGNELIGKDVKETQKIIENLLGMSFETFCQTVYFSQNSLKKFVTATQEDRGKILSEIQELEIFDKARKETQNLLKNAEQEKREFIESLRIFNSSYTSNIKRIEQYLKSFEMIKEQRERQVKELNQDIKDVENQINTLDSEILELNSKYSEDILEGLASQQQELVKAKDLIQENFTKLKVKRSSISNLIERKANIQSSIDREARHRNLLFIKITNLKKSLTEDNSSCPECGKKDYIKDNAKTLNEISEVSKIELESVELLILLKKQYEELRIPENQELNEEEVKLNKAKTEIDASIKEISNQINNINKTFTKIESLVSKAVYLSEHKKGIEAKLIPLINNLEDFDWSVKIELEVENSKRLRDIQETEENLKETQIQLNRLELLKDGFKEVKAYTFNSILNELSVKANHYLSELFEIPIKITFNNEDMKISLDIKIDGFDRSHGLLSGGQQKRVSLAVDLALSDIITSRTGSLFNLLILDEPFQNLSEASMERCITLLTRLNKPIIIIEHNSIAKTMVNQTFTIEYQNGISKAI